MKAINNKTMDILTVIERKHELGKDMAQFREQMSKQQDKRKMDYATYLYGLKSKHTDTMFEQSMARLKYIHEVSSKGTTRHSKKK